MAQGLDDVGSSLANPDSALLDHPGKQIAEGQFRGLLVDGSLQEGGQVVALETTEEGQRLAIIPYLEGDPCYVPSVRALSRLSSRVDVNLPGIVSIQPESDDGAGPISFVDFQCEEVIEPLATNRLPNQVFPPSQPWGVLSLQDNGSLRLIDPRAREVIDVAEDIVAYSRNGDQLWVIQRPEDEKSRLVIFEADLEVSADFGKDVRLFVGTGGSRFPVAFLDQEGLSVWGPDEGTRLVSATGCQPEPVGPDAIAYYDPCPTAENVSADEVFAHIFAPGKLLGLEADTADLKGPNKVSRLASTQADWSDDEETPSIFLFTQSEKESGAGSLVVAHFFGESEEVSNDDDDEADEARYELNLEPLDDRDMVISGGQIYRKWNGQWGDLMMLDQDEESRVVGISRVAKDVGQLPGGSPYSPRGVLTAFDGETGALAVLSNDNQEDQIEATVLAEGVPQQSHVVEAETSQTAFVSDSSDGRIGTLRLSYGSSAPLKEPKRISEHVLVDTARFLPQPRALAFLYRPPEKDHAELRVWLIDAELLLVIHDRVSEYRPVPWPAPGILYAVATGKDQGLWWAKAR